MQFGFLCYIYVMAKAKKIETEYKCKDCAFSHSPYSLNWKEENVLAKCEKSEFSVLLSQNMCNSFKKA